MQPYVKVTQSIDAPTLLCPVCGYHHSHVAAVYTLLGGDESGGLYRGSHLVGRETPYRRDALAVRVDGECVESILASRRLPRMHSPGTAHTRVESMMGPRVTEHRARVHIPEDVAAHELEVT